MLPVIVPPAFGNALSAFPKDVCTAVASRALAIEPAFSTAEIA